MIRLDFIQLEELDLQALQLIVPRISRFSPYHGRWVVSFLFQKDTCGEPWITPAILLVNYTPEPFRKLCEHTIVCLGK